MYDVERNEIGYSTTTTTQGKTFVIDHPLDNDKYLVHACLEGPEGGVYYRGKGKITNNEYVEIDLPSYVSKLAFEFTILLTPIRKPKNKQSKENKPVYLETSEVIDNKFTVYGENTDFYWLVQGKRIDVETEPFKNKTQVEGSGPYKWIK